MKAIIKLKVQEATLASKRPCPLITICSCWRRWTFLEKKIVSFNDEQKGPVQGYSGF